MFDHLDIAVSDLAASRRFYTLALGEPDAVHEWIEWGAFGITPVSDEHPLTQHLHVGFGVEDRAAVDRWWQQMTGAGYRSDGEPGPRPQYNPSYYGGFILDPDHNSVEAVHHERSRTGQVDHVWFRTADLAATRRFYTTIAGTVGIRLGLDQPDWIRFSDGQGSFSFVPGTEPTRNVHFAFALDSKESVAAFHDAATAAGYTSNGEPAERPHYHPGYYGAFVLDPNSNNVEAVFHDRTDESNDRNHLDGANVEAVNHNR